MQRIVYPSRVTLVGRCHVQCARWQNLKTRCAFRCFHVSLVEVRFKLSTSFHAPQDPFLEEMKVSVEFEDCANLPLKKHKMSSCFFDV